METLKSYILKTLMGQAGSLNGKLLSEFLLQSGVKSALFGSEPSPWAMTWRALEGVGSLQGKHVLHMPCPGERGTGHTRVCLSA